MWYGNGFSMPVLHDLFPRPIPGTATTSVTGSTVAAALERSAAGVVKSGEDGQRRSRQSSPRGWVHKMSRYWTVLGWVVVLTMHGEKQYAIRVLRAGADGYRNKKSALDQLV